MATAEGVVWVIAPGVVSHLAVADRGGYVSHLLHRPTCYFRTPYEALPTLWQEGAPAGIAVENVPKGEFADLMKLTELRDVPVVMVDQHWPASEARPDHVLDVSWKDATGNGWFSVGQALEVFAATYFGAAAQ